MLKLTVKEAKTFTLKMWVFGIAFSIIGFLVLSVIRREFYFEGLVLSMFVYYFAMLLSTLRIKKVQNKP